MPGLVLPILVAILPLTGDGTSQEARATSSTQQELAKVWDVKVPPPHTREMPRIPTTIGWSGEFAGAPCTIAADIPSGGFKINVTLRF